MRKGRPDLALQRPWFVVARPDGAYDVMALPRYGSTASLVAGYLSEADARLIAWASAAAPDVSPTRNNEAQEECPHE